MSEIVEFPKRDEEEPMLWQCGSCGGMAWGLRSDHTIECCICGHVSAEAPGWWVPLQQAEGDPPEYRRTISRHATPDLARHSVIKAAKDDPEAALVVIHRDGTVTTSAPLEWHHTDEGRQWLLEQMPTVQALLTGCKTG